MQTMVKLENAQNKIKLTNVEPSNEFSAYIWRIDDVHTKNKERVHISGWTKANILEINVTKPGNYYAQVFFKSGDSVVTNTISIDNRLYLIDDNEHKMMLQNLRVEFEKNSQLMQKMYVAGSECIVKRLTHLLQNKRLNVFAPDMDSMRIGNMIFASEFFNNDLRVNSLLGLDRTVIGYQISMSFRTQYDILTNFVDESDSEDMFLVVDTVPLNAKAKVQLKKAESKGAKVISLSDVVAQAFNERYIVQPLIDVAKNGTTVVTVKFPRATDIINKSEEEEIAGKTTIAKIRTDLRNGIYPEILSNLDVDTEYMNEVMDGWALVPQEGAFDRLKDKSGKYVNIEDGHRIIPAMQKAHSDKKTGLFSFKKKQTPGQVCFFGNSVMYGIGSDDNHTLPSLIAEYALSDGKNFDFENHANFSMNDYVRAGNLIKSMTFNENDVVVFGAHLKFEDDQIERMGGYFVDLQPAFERPHDLGEVFIDMTHMNKNGYTHVANTVYQYLTDNHIL